MKVHTFDNSFNIGRQGEKLVEEYFISRGFDVNKVSIQLEYLLSIDFIISKGDRRFKVEVKTDEMSLKTGNLFVETKVADKLGWLHKYDSHSKVILIYAFVPIRELWFIDMKDFLTIDFTKYSIREVRNPSYSAYGHLIPMREVKDKFIIRTL